MRSIVLVLLLPLIALAALACSSTDPIPLPAVVGPLVTVEWRGGECFAAPCGSTVILERDGRVHNAVKQPNDLGIVPAPQLVALSDAISAADFGALKGVPFTGECPTAFDGQELVFEFATLGGTQRIATCEVEVDFGSPLFVAIGVALGPYVPLPLT